MSETHTTSTGWVTTELGVKQNTMMAMNDQVKNVYTVNLWHVAQMVVAETHHVMMR